MAESPPPITGQLNDWERATRERGTEPTSRGTARELQGRGTQNTAAGEKGTLQQRRARRQQLSAFQAAVKPPTTREQQLDRLEREMAGLAAGGAAATIVNSQKNARPAKSHKWEDGRWGVGFGNSWADSEARKVANKVLGRPESQKPADSDLKADSKYAIAYWAARNKTTQELESAGLREMTCLTMMKEPLQAYVRVAGMLSDDKGEREKRLDDVMTKAKDARSVGAKEVEEARGTVVVEELRKQLGFETVHVDAVPNDPTKYWNNKKNRNYSSDEDAHNKDRRLPQLNFRKVEGADSHQEIDVSVGIDHFVKLGKKMTPESRKWWDALNETEFAVGVADQGFHTFAISRGYVYEVHWDRGPDNPTLTDKRSLKDFFDVNRKDGGTHWSSGIIAVPPEALPKRPRPE